MTAETTIPLLVIAALLVGGSFAWLSWQARQFDKAYPPKPDEKRAG